MAKKKKEQVSNDTPEVSSGNEEVFTDIEVVQPIPDDKLELLLAPVKEEENVELVETAVETVGITVPEDKMVHRKLGMYCNSCFIADSCPQFKEDSPCTIEWGRLFKGEFTPTDMLQSAVAVLDLQLMRVQRGATFEALNQGVLDPELSREVSRYFELLQQFKALSERQQPTISITAKGEATKSGGVLSKLLGL